jgi:hypothetical protein
VVYQSPLMCSHTYRHPNTTTPPAFCDGAMGKYCDHLRVLRINESESLGPAMARYFASKLWHGEAFYMQIDAHMFFAEVGWWEGLEGGLIWSLVCVTLFVLEGGLRYESLSIRSRYEIDGG